MNAEQLYKAIERKHPEPAWACFAEVNQGTGSNAGRRADALAMSLWPSRGLIIRGFEIKVSKSDLRKEIKTPAKADAIASYCHEWWLVVPKGLIDDMSDIPDSWGVMELGKTLRSVKRAKSLKPKAVSYVFLASVLRASYTQRVNILSKYIDPNTISDKLNRSYERGKADGVVRCKHVNNTYESLVRKMTDLTDVLGVSLGDYGRDSIDQAVEDMKVGRAFRGEEIFAGGVQGVLTQVDRTLSKLSTLRDNLSVLTNKDA